MRKLHIFFQDSSVFSDAEKHPKVSEWLNNIFNNADLGAFFLGGQLDLIIYDGFTDSILVCDPQTLQSLVAEITKSLKAFPSIFVLNIETDSIKEGFIHNGQFNWKSDLNADCIINIQDGQTIANAIGVFSVN